MATFAPSNTKPTAKPILLPRPAPSAGMGSHGLRFETNRVASGAGADVSFGMRVGGVMRRANVLTIQPRIIKPTGSTGISLNRSSAGVRDVDAGSQRSIEMSAGFGNATPGQARQLQRAIIPTQAQRSALTMSDDVAAVRSAASQLRFGMQ